VDEVDHDVDGDAAPLGFGADQVKLVLGAVGQWAGVEFAQAWRYPAALLVQVRELIAAGRLAEMVAHRHPEAHNVRTEGALYDYVNELKSSHMRSAPPLAKVAYDAKLHIMKNVLAPTVQSRASRAVGSRPSARSASPPSSRTPRPRCST